jgi:Helicase associated domain
MIERFERSRRKNREEATDNSTPVHGFFSASLSPSPSLDRMEEEEEGRHNVPPPQGQPIGPSVDDEEVGFAAAVAAAAEEEKKVPAPAAPSSTRPREVLATAESESNDPAADAANASNNNSSSNSNSSNNPDPDHVALVRDGLLCDEDTEAVLAEVEGTLHQDEAATTTTMTATEPSAHLDGSESSRKRKAEEEGLTGGGSRHVLHRHEGNNEDGIYGNLPHDPNDDENHGHSNDDDGFGDEGGGSDNHHRLHHQHHHHSLLDSNSAAAAAPYDPASGIGVGIDGGEGEAIAAAAAVAAAAAAAALTSTTSPSMGAPTARRALSAARKSAPPRVSWEDRIEQLRSYKAEHGDLLIPIRYRDNPSLGKFVHNTREQYKLFHKRAPANYKKKCSLTQERIEQLDQIGTRDTR